MGFFNSWKSHYLVGWMYGASVRALPKGWIERKIVDLDRWAWAREEAQAGQPILSPHKIREAGAWGAGMRKATASNPDYPKPPYPATYEWSTEKVEY